MKPSESWLMVIVIDAETVLTLQLVWIGAMGGVVLAQVFLLWDGPDRVCRLWRRLISRFRRVESPAPMTLSPEAMRIARRLQEACEASLMSKEDAGIVAERLARLGRS